MILVKDRTGSKNGTADSTLVGVFDSKRPLYRIVKWLILHIFPPVFRLLYGFRVVGRIPEEKMQNGCISVCNHVHKLDCVMLACVFQDYTMQFLSLESNLHIPVAGAIVRLMGGIGLPAKLDGWRPVLKRIKQGLDEGQMLQIYPEGELIRWLSDAPGVSAGCVSDRVLVPEADDSVPAAVLSAFFQKRQTKKGRNGAGYFRAGGHSDR